MQTDMQDFIEEQHERFQQLEALCSALWARCGDDSNAVALAGLGMEIAERSAEDCRAAMDRAGEAA